MARTPKGFNPQTEDIKKLIIELDRMFRYVRADIEKQEEITADHEQRIDTLET